MHLPEASAHTDSGAASTPLFSQPRGMARRHAVPKAPLGDCLGKLATRPLAHGATGRAGRFTGQGHNLAVRFRGARGGAPGPGGIGSPLFHAQVLQRDGLQAQPALAPEAHSLHVPPRWWAIWTLFNPAAAASMLRARKATCWAVVYRRTRVSSPCRSSAVSATLGGFGPRMSLSQKCTKSDHTTLVHANSRGPSSAGVSAKLTVPILYVI